LPVWDPQAVAPRTAAGAQELLARDADRVCRHFERFVVETDVEPLAADLWRRFLYARL